MQNSSQSSQPKKINFIDILRGFAILSVVLVHSTQPLWAQSHIALLKVRPFAFLKEDKGLYFIHN
jgi:hypothetical protein